MEIQKTLIIPPFQFFSTAYFEGTLDFLTAFILDSQVVNLILMNRSMNLPDEFNEVRIRLLSSIFKTTRQADISNTDIQIAKEIFVKMMTIQT